MISYLWLAVLVFAGLREVEAGSNDEKATEYPTWMSWHVFRFQAWGPSGPQYGRSYMSSNVAWRGAWLVTISLFLSRPKHASSLSRVGSLDLPYPEQASICWDIDHANPVSSGAIDPLPKQCIMLRPATSLESLHYTSVYSWLYCTLSNMQDMWSPTSWMHYCCT